MTALRKRRFVEGSGRRYIDAAVSGAPQRYGSSTLSMTNSAGEGTSMPTRISPLVSSRLYAARRLATLETSALPQFDPSFVRKTGSRPRESSNRRRTDSGVSDHPSAGRWQEKQLRPLVPSAVKNGFERSIGPFTLTVRTNPESLAATSARASSSCANMCRCPIMRPTPAPTHTTIQAVTKRLDMAAPVWSGRDRLGGGSLIWPSGHLRVRTSHPT